MNDLDRWIDWVLLRLGACEMPAGLKERILMVVATWPGEPAHSTSKQRLN